MNETTLGILTSGINEDTDINTILKDGIIDLSIFKENEKESKITERYRAARRKVVSKSASLSETLDSPYYYIIVL